MCGAEIAINQPMNVTCLECNSNVIGVATGRMGYRSYFVGMRQQEREYLPEVLYECDECCIRWRTVMTLPFDVEP